MEHKNEGAELVLLSGLVSELISNIERKVQSNTTGVPLGPVTNLPKLDESLGGFLAQGLHVLQAAPGAGKSALALQLAATCQFPALYLTAEMAVLELFFRLIARATETFLGRLKTGELGVKETLRLALQTAERLPHLALLDSTAGYAPPAQLEAAAEALRRHTGSPQVLLVVDSLQVWAKTARRQEPALAAVSEYDLLNVALGELAAVASRLGCPVLAVSHRNRAGNRAQDASLHAAKGSGEVEYLAETVLDLTRKSDAPDRNGEIEVKLTLLKNRHGIPGITLPLLFSGRLQRFRVRRGQRCHQGAEVVQRRSRCHRYRRPDEFAQSGD